MCRYKFFLVTDDFAFIIPVDFEVWSYKVNIVRKTVRLLFQLTDTEDFHYAVHPELVLTNVVEVRCTLNFAVTTNPDIGSTF
jgi:hypothetical protein